MRIDRLVGISLSNVFGLNFGDIRDSASHQEQVVGGCTPGVSCQQVDANLRAIDATQLKISGIQNSRINKARG